MFTDDILKNHLETASTVSSQAAVIAEWNMNIPNNIALIGNYRYRPTESASIYRSIPNTFDPNDSGNYYTDATTSDIVIDGGYSDSGLPFNLTSKKDKLAMLYSLEDCFKPFRPRSGINKACFFPVVKNTETGEVLSGRFLHNPNINMVKRPRYYMADKDDKFKYWTSYRTENNIEYGISNKQVNGQYLIEDTAPFIVYKNTIPVNRLVVKMQTHTGTVDLGSFYDGSNTFSDPFFGDVKKETPLRWKIQYLKNNNWIDAFAFNSSSVREDGTPIIKSDGYVELSYGLKVPDMYKDFFIDAGVYSSNTLIPEQSVYGYSYLILDNEEDIGVYHIWTGSEYETFIPEYGWKLEEETVNRLTNFVTDLTAPKIYTNSYDGFNSYREFEYISGARIVVDSMNRSDATLDLIEISPRLSVNLSDKVVDYKVTKMASDLGVSGLPVSQLLASTGSLTIFDFDDSFTSSNSNSIIKDYITRHIQIKFYEVISNVSGYDYFIPIKTMYSEGFPDIDSNQKTATLSLRDMYFYFESIAAPQILLTNVSVSSAVALLLDSIGFSNYSFMRVENESEVIIPFFFVQPDTTVAQVLQELAISTQTAMFFDEYNNFIMMSKNYMMPSENERGIDFILDGTTKNANIIQIDSQNNDVYNDGVINYDTRYIQRSYGSIRQSSLIDNEKTWIYKPVLLWEVSGSQNTKSINNEISNQSAYVLSAIPLNSDLSDAVPTVLNNEVINNVMDLGEGVYWITRYNGYFYSSGEIIKFDAVQYNVSGYGNVWINNVEEYQNYFSKLPFNGKIYPTGLVRIYTEPNYEYIDNILKLKTGVVAKHGRGQFGTTVVSHSSGISQYWQSNDNVRGCTMQSKYLFSYGLTPPAITTGAAGINNSLAKKTSRNGIIKNFLASSYKTESEINAMTSTQTGTIQSSALVMNGPSFTTTETPLDFISYVYKPLENRFKHFGTRMRVVGKIENNLDKGQSAVGSTTYFVVPGTTPETSINISGGSGGLAVLLNPETNNGYYFEIVALGTSTIDTSQNSNVNNIIFYKVGQNNGSAIPVKLWEGLSNIIVDDGKFTGQYRMAAEENPTVYDLAVEYIDIGSTRRFFLYINNKLITTVDDKEPLPTYNNMALFVRGSSRCMFENIYALTNNYSQNTIFDVAKPLSDVFGDNEVDANESFRRYAMSGIIQSTYLSGISSYQPPDYNIYFDEFGTIMREAATFNIKYDKAYPALSAELSPTFNRLKGYTVSGFRAGSYGAEFMIFNSTDTALSLDETTGNYLRIQGVTFTQESKNTLTVDNYFTKNSDFSNPEFNKVDPTTYPQKIKKDYEDIKTSRMTYGKKDFTLDVPYIQTQDDANSLMSWMISKIMKPRKSVGLKIFSIPTLQLGDIVSINYKEKEIDKIDSENKRYVVYHIEYSKNVSGPEMTVYVSEVL
jgi:hypothetical protein